jgi:hypothetical protein
VLFAAKDVHVVKTLVTEVDGKEERREEGEGGRLR